MTTGKLSDHAELPDDLADACRAITRTLSPLTDFARGRSLRQELQGRGFKAAQRVLAAFGDDGAEEGALRVLGSMEGENAGEA